MFSNQHRIRKPRALLAAAAALTASVAIAACGDDGGATSTQVDVVEPSSAANPGADLPQGSEPVKLDPSEFTTKIDNPYMPWTPGSRWVYEETDTEGGLEKVVVEVTDKTKTLANGVEAVVVSDIVSEDGVPTEVTDDYYAQDADGNVWYLGEATQEYVNGMPGTREGSFEAGVGGAQAGIAMPANPEPGMEYRQEYLKGEAEDEGAIVTVGQEQVEVPFGFYDRDLVMTRDTNPLEPKVQELKFWAPGIGQLLAVHTDGAGGREELVSYEPGS